MRIRRLTTRAAAAALLWALPGLAGAGLVTFTGQDLGSGPVPAHPNSDAAAAQFDAAAAALGAVSTATFESAPLGSFHSLAAAPGLTVTGADAQGQDQTVRNSSGFPPNPAVDGSNTTAGGSQFVEVHGGNLVFTFAQPTQFFGFYVTGVQTSFFADKITFDDGTSQTVLVPGIGTSGNTGATAFVGFTDAGKAITSVTLVASTTNSGVDYVGVDDVRFQSVVAIPEPSSVVACASGLAAVAAGAWRGRRRAGA